MKLIDFDGMFDEKLTVYMEENKNKYTERQWEDIIPKLYKKFGDTFVAKIKCTPKEYYAKMSDSELTQTLLEHLKQDIPAPEFLCAEIENRGAVETLTPMLNLGGDSAVYAFNLIGDDERAYETYFELLIKDETDEDLKSDIADLFKAHADLVKDKVLSAYRKGENKEAMLEILSRVKEKSDELYEILLTEFLTYENIPMRASYLASYGDERALPHLLKKIEERSIGFIEFQELKYAIEALGGEYDEPRDFTDDKDYLAVETASAKSPFPEN